MLKKKEKVLAGSVSLVFILQFLDFLQPQKENNIAVFCIFS